MFENRKKIYSVILVLSILLILVVSVPQATQPQPAKAQFVIAEWDYPADQYGQGIKLFHFYDNSTGSWVEFSTLTGYKPDNSSNVECPAGVGIKIRISTSLNSTLLGLGGETEGFNFIRHNLTVTSLGETIFSQQNFTMFNYGHIGAMYSYNYEVILGFLPVQGTIYTLTFTYEIFY